MENGGRPLVLQTMVGPVLRRDQGHEASRTRGIRWGESLCTPPGRCGGLPRRPGGAEGFRFRPEMGSVQMASTETPSMHSSGE